MAITKDKKIRLQDASIHAIVQARTVVLILIGKWTHQQLAVNLINSIYVIHKRVKKEKPPCILKLHMAVPSARRLGRAGKVEVYRNRTDLLEEYQFLKYSI